MLNLKPKTGSDLMIDRPKTLGRVKTLLTRA